MKSCSFISLSRSQSSNPSIAHEHPFSLDTAFKDEAQISVLPARTPKLQTLIEVYKCQFARPNRTSKASTKGSSLEPSKKWSSVHYAAYHKREAALLHFLQVGQNPDGPTTDVDTPLLVATAVGHAEVVRILCAAGANVRATTKENGETSLHIAIRLGHADITETLLASSMDLDARTTDSWETPLHYAAAKPGCLATVVSLLKGGANYELHDCKSRSAAELAITSSNIPAAVAIINASRGNRKRLAKEKDMLLRHVEKVQNRFSMNNDLIADIFEASCDPSSTVLVEAIKKNDSDLAQMFLEKGADPNRPTSRGVHPIFAALNCPGAQMVQLLAKHGVDGSVRNVGGANVLQTALGGPNVQDREVITIILEALLDAGADATVTDTARRTLLHQVVTLRLPTIAIRLIDAGIKVNASDNTGCTALHHAVQSKRCTEILLKHGANTRSINHEGLTPLLHCLHNTAKGIETDLEPLIKASDLQDMTYDGKTALHLAAEKGLEQTVCLLVKHRADPATIDSKKQTALLLAVMNQQWSIVSILAALPGINNWDEGESTALHHIATSIPQAPATWQAIASAAAKFCERGSSRSMRDGKGATPLILAIRTLPEEGVPVIEALLAEKGPAKGNCVGHEDHHQRTALYYAATLGKPRFVLALLKGGAPFMLKDWASNCPIKPNKPAHRQTLKYIADFDWMRRGQSLFRKSDKTSVGTLLPKLLPLHDLEILLSMGLDPNSLPVPPKSNMPRSLLWTVLLQISNSPLRPGDYFHSVLALLLTTGADTNTLLPTSLNQKSRSHRPSRTPSPQPTLFRHPLTFLLEEHADVPLPYVSLLLAHEARLTVPSTHYNGRYPLHSAVEAGRIDIIELLLAKNADINVPDAKKHSPLALAIENSACQIVELLLSRKVNLGSRDSDGNTLLHVAACQCQPTVISALLRKGARVSVRNDAKKSPAECVPNKDAMADREDDRIRTLQLLEDAQRRETWSTNRQQIRREKSTQEHEKEKSRLEQEARREGKERLRKERETTRTAPLAAKAGAISHIINPADFSPSIKRDLSSSFKKKRNSNQRQPDPVFASMPTALPIGKFQASHKAQVPKSAFLQKSPPQPRIDSGFGQAKRSPELDRIKETPDAPRGRVRESRKSQDDLQEWLALSKMLD